MKILVTGGTGFIGSHLIKRLLQLDNKVILLKQSFSDTWRINDLRSKLKIYEIDKLKDYESFFKKNKIDIIVHLAAKYLKNNPSTDEIKEMNYSNITIPSQLLDIASKSGVKGFINTGTFFEYKLRNIINPINETSPKEPYNYYTVTKIAFEEILKLYCLNLKIKGVSLKLFSAYGEKDNQKIIPLIIKSFINKKRLDLTDGGQKLNFTYVGDIVNAYVRAICYIMSKTDFKYEYFNIGDSKSYSIKEIVKRLKKITKKTGMVNFGALKLPKDEGINIRCNFSKAKKYLNWSPRVNITTGLTRTYRYYMKTIL